MRVVCAVEDRERPNAQDKAERLMAATGHLEDVVATRHQPGVAAVFMTVGDADTPWHRQFFITVTFES